MAKPDHTVLARLSVAPRSDSTPFAHDPPHSADIVKLPLQHGQNDIDVVATMFSLARLVRINNECREAKLAGLPMKPPQWPLQKELADSLEFAIVHLCDYARMLDLERKADE